MWKRIQCVVLLAAAGLAGCAAAPPDWRPSDGSARTFETVMARRDKIIRLSPAPAPAGKPILLLLHGATDDPTEMMPIVREWRDAYDVYLYSYNYHQSIKKVGSDLAGEMKRLEARNSRAGPMTILDFSYSAVVFRETVILANDPALFAGDSLIQLVPTAGGSHLARTMEFPFLAWLVSLASHPSAAVNPYGRLSKELWDGEGNRRFYEAINPARMRTFLVQGDTHSLAGTRNKGVLRRYENGIGRNVIIIPKGAGVTHEYFPSEQAGLAYLRTALERPPSKTAAKNTPLSRPETPRKRQQAVKQSPIPAS